MEPNSAPANAPVKSIQLLTQIMTGLRHRYASLNDVPYEAALTDSWVHVRCFHKHSTLIDAAKCGMPQPGFYVLAVDGGAPRALSPGENEIVDRIRFAGLPRLRTNTEL